MKMLTLNTHSLQEDNYAEKLEWFVGRMLDEQPDVIALQEVNQTITAPEAPMHMHKGLAAVPHGIALREDNHAAAVAMRLRLAGMPCSWAWLPAKIGYGKYDEGLAILCPHRAIRRAQAYAISRTDDYANWRTRRMLGVQLEGMDDWFCTVHMGWWNDEEEPFRDQWRAVSAALEDKRKHAPVWLMGDFNAPAEVRGESYDCIADSGWKDTYLTAERKDGGMTVSGVIDGWRDRTGGQEQPGGMRIDQIWCSHDAQIRSSQVIFNGGNGPVVSDHYGVIITTD
ncbi:MAG: endonuclease/exonuclease/phosphatase family protein [Clostridia bacterium]|nr:endonuclease/exonuclease/phosphatase family protein [Clostridia bacterium]